MPKRDDLKPLPDHVVAPLPRARVHPAPAGEPVILQPVTEAHPPFWTTEGDYSVIWRSTKVGRISYDHKPYAGEDSAATAYRHDSIEPRYARSHADRAPITRHAHNQAAAPRPEL